MTLTPKTTPGVGMVLIKSFDLYLPSCQIWTQSIKGSSKYEVLLTLTQKLWPCDGKTNERTYERTNVRTNVRTNQRKSENYIPPHTSYVGGIKMQSHDALFCNVTGSFKMNPYMAPDCLSRAVATTIRTNKKYSWEMCFGPNAKRTWPSAIFLIHAVTRKILL